jgi:hypothetical protein
MTIPNSLLSKQEVMKRYERYFAVMLTRFIKQGSNPKAHDWFVKIVAELRPRLKKPERIVDSLIEAGGIVLSDYIRDDTLSRLATYRVVSEHVISKELDKHDGKRVKSKATLEADLREVQNQLDQNATDRQGLSKKRDALFAIIAAYDETMSLIESR